MHRDLLTLVCLVALLALLTRQGTAPPAPATPTASPDPRFLEFLPESHDVYCSRRRSARVEYLNSGDPKQRARLKRGEVVYVTFRLNGELLPQCQSDLKLGKAVCSDGGYGPSPVPGESWYCKSCHSFWGKHYPTYSYLLDHF